MNIEPKRRAGFSDTVRIASMRPEACWLWIGAKNSKGYGTFYPGLNQAYLIAHRVAWFLANGPIPRGMWVLHKCDNPLCCRPSHLFLGDQSANMQDMISKGRGALQTHPELVRRGEASKSAKLTEKQVKQIRELRASGMSQSKLGRMFGVTKVQIRHIEKRTSWKHVIGLLLCLMPLMAQEQPRFPGALAGDTDLIIELETASSSLAANITAGDLAITLSSASTFPTSGAIVIDSEIVNYCSKAGQVLTVCASGRGFSGTGAASHTAGAFVAITKGTAIGHNRLAAEVKAIEAFLGISGANVSAIAHTHPASAIISGLLLRARGGTGTDLSATGCSGCFLRQNSAGGDFTVSQITGSDLPGTITINSLTQITSRSHTLLTDIGSNTHAQIDTHVAATAGAHSATSANTANRIVERDGSGNLSAGVITATLSGNASTATTAGALTADPADCSGNNFALGINAAGTAQCAQPAFSNLSGAIVLAQTPLTTRGDILIVNSTPGLARLAKGAANTYPKSDGSDVVYSTLAAGGVGTCASKNWVNALNADSAPTCAQPAASDLSNGVTGSGAVVLATSPTTTNQTNNQAANGNDAFSSSRATDAAPTGNFQRYKTFAGADLWVVDITGTLTAGSIPTARLASSSITVTGTSNQINVAGSPVSLGGTVTLSTPQNIHTAATPTFNGLTLSANTLQIILGTTNTTTLTMAALTASRIVTFPNADSNTVQPSTAPANQFATAISSAGVVTYAQPAFSNLSGSIAIGQTPLTTRGDLFVAGAGPVTARLALGASGLYPRSNGSDLIFSTLAAAGVGSCTNQFARALNADAAPTCATVANTDLTNSSLTVTAGNLLSGGGSIALGASATLNAYARYSSFCSGTATASATLLVTLWNSAACTNTSEGVAQQVLVSSAGILRNLRVLAGTAGAAGGSGVVTLRKNAADTAVTCTVGTGTTCSDTSNTASVVAGDKITVKVVTAGAETLADVQIAFEL